MFNRAYESLLLEPPRIHGLAAFLRVAAELPGEGDSGPAPALVTGMHILSAIIDYRGNHAGLEDVGAEQKMLSSPRPPAKPHRSEASRFPEAGRS